MIRNIAMLGLMATFLTLGACDDICGGCDAEAPSESSGAAVQVDGCGDCLEGCDDAAAMGSGGLAADGAGDAPLACPVSGTDAEGVCGVVDKDNCGMAGDCSVETDAEASCETQCETQCDEKPAAPSVTD